MPPNPGPSIFLTPTKVSLCEWNPGITAFVPSTSFIIWSSSFRVCSERAFCSFCNSKNRELSSLYSACAAAISFEPIMYRFVISSMILGKISDSWASNSLSFAFTAIRLDSNWLGRWQTATIMVFVEATRDLWANSEGTPRSVNSFKRRCAAFTEGPSPLYPITTPFCPISSIKLKLIIGQPAKRNVERNDSAVCCALPSATDRNSTCIPDKDFKAFAKEDARQYPLANFHCELQSGAFLRLPVVFWFH